MNNYANISQKMKNNVTEVDDALLGITKVDFSSVWSGDVYSKLSSDLSNTIKKVDVEKNNFETFSSVMEDLESYKAMKEKISSLSDEIEKVKNNCPDKEDDSDGYDKAQREISDLENQIETLKSQMEKLKVNIESMLSTIKANTADLSIVDYSVFSYDWSGDTSLYINLPEKGFVVTVGNKTYDLTEEEFSMLCGVVAGEAQNASYDDCLAVATTILNRCEDERYVSKYKTSNPVGQAFAPYQFTVTQRDWWRKHYFRHGDLSNFRYEKYPCVVEAVTAALNGVRNHDYLTFRSCEIKSYSNNQLCSTGNRYK